MCVRPERRKAGRKSLLFLKKKKQKDFYPFAQRLPPGQTDKSFLVLFFKKEPLAF
jgi:hypothetical protein